MNEFDDKYFKKSLVEEIGILESYKRQLSFDIQQLESTKRNMDLELDNYKKALGEYKSVPVLQAALSANKQLDKRIKELSKEKQKAVKTQELIIKETAVMEQTFTKMTESYFTPTDKQVTFYNDSRGPFLEAYIQRGTIKGACSLLAKQGILLQPATVKYFLVRDTGFQKDLKIAYELFKDSINEEMVDRALNGTETPTLYKGEHIDDVVMPDNRLLETVAKAHAPELYDRGKLDRLPDADKPTINIQMVNFSDSQLSADQALQKAIGVVRSVSADGIIDRNTLSNNEDEDVITIEAEVPDNEE